MSVFSHPGLSFVSLSVSLPKRVLVIVGVDENLNFYISLYDYLGSFVLSTTEAPVGVGLSVLSCVIDPLSADITILGRSQATSAGSLLRTYPPLYN